jgi:Zn-dependent protease with chaperone function
MLVVAALVVLAVVLAWPAPRALAAATSLRREPRAALVLWQSTAVAAVLAALLAAPAAIPAIVGPSASIADQWPILGIAALLSGLVAGRLLLSGDRVGRNLRAARRRHRELVDLIGDDHPADRHTRVLEHTTPTAYCVPGVQRRVVVTQGTVERLAPDELDAVLAHERAHLRARHDLIMEFFTVVHEAVPRFVRSEAALHEVHLLIEVLADRAAVRAAGVLSTARAIVGMAGGPKPAGTMAMRESTADARARIELLDAGRIAGLPHAVTATAMYAVSLLLVVAPLALFGLGIAEFARS